MKRLVNVGAVTRFKRDMKILFHVPTLRLFIVQDRKFGREWARKVLDNFWRIFPPVFYVRQRVRHMLWYLQFVFAFIKLTYAWIRHGECFVVSSGFCCDTGYFSSEYRYTNPWTAMRRLYYLNTVEWSDGASSGRIGDGDMWRWCRSKWRDDYHYSQAPYGWDALKADQESEDDERYEREVLGDYD